MFIKVLVLIASILLLSCEATEEVSETGLPELEGTWLSSCSLNIYSEYVTHELVFLNNTLNTTTLYFDNSSCSGSPIDLDDSYGTYVVGDAITTPLGYDVLEFDYTVVITNASSPFTLTSLDIIYIDSNQIYLGEGNGGVFTRPIEIDFNHPFIKQ